MDGDTTTSGHSNRLREGIRSIIALKHHRTGLCQHSGMRIDHSLLTVDTWIDRRLLNHGSAVNDGTRLTNTFYIHLRTSDDDLTTTFQVTALIHMTDDDLRSREHDTMLVTNILTIIQTVKDFSLHLLNGLFLLMNLCEILLHAALEVIQNLLPIIKYITHNLSP